MVVKDDKKELIIQSALRIFAERGYYKATTAMVAKEAGVTQPYVFHFFVNKEDLYKVVIDRAYNRIYDTFSMIDAPVEKLIETMGHGFTSIIETHRDEVLMVMQAYAIPDTGIREHVRQLYLNMYESLTLKFDRAELPNPGDVASKFIATGLLIAVSEVLELPQICEEKNEMQIE